MRYLLAPFLFSATLLSAGVIDSNTVSFNVNGTETDQVTQFNPALGTLTGITVFYNNVVVGMEDIATMSTSQSPIHDFEDFESGFNLTLPGVSTFSPWFSITETQFGCFSGSGEFTSCTNTGTFTNPAVSGSMAISPSPNFSAYIGTGTLAVSLVSEQDLSNLNTTNASAVSNGIDDVQNTGSYYLEYAYDPATSPTPEPASFAMIGGGLALLASIARLRRRLLS